MEAALRKALLLTLLVPAATIRRSSTGSCSPVHSAQGVPSLVHAAWLLRTIPIPTAVFHSVDALTRRPTRHKQLSVLLISASKLAGVLGPLG